MCWSFNIHMTHAFSCRPNPPLTDPSLEPFVVTKVSHVRLDILHCTELLREAMLSFFWREKTYPLCYCIYLIIQYHHISFTVATRIWSALRGHQHQHRCCLPTVIVCSARTRVQKIWKILLMMFSIYIRLQVWMKPIWYIAHPNSTQHNTWFILLLHHITSHHLVIVSWWLYKAKKDIPPYFPSFHTLNINLLVVSFPLFQYTINKIRFKHPGNSLLSNPAVFFNSSMNSIRNESDGIYCTTAPWLQRCYM